MDVNSILTSELWRVRISSAVANSAALVAVVSPSFLKSEWCRTEWDLFVSKEAAVRRERGLPDDFGLIFPILLYPFTRARLSQDEREFSKQVLQRQYRDFSSALDHVELRPAEVQSLVETIIDVLYEVSLSSLSKVGEPRIGGGTMIIDVNTDCIWSGFLSPAMSLDDAREYARSFHLGGLGDWRLPTVDELRGLIDSTAFSKGAEDDVFPLREPFNVRRWGRLHSCSLVNQANPSYGHWIMNMRNGHVFNGLGEEAFVRPVRAIDFDFS